MQTLTYLTVPVHSIACHSRPSLIEWQQRLQLRKIPISVDMLKEFMGSGFSMSSLQTSPLTAVMASSDGIRSSIISSMMRQVQQDSKLSWTLSRALRPRQLPFITRPLQHGRDWSFFFGKLYLNYFLMIGDLNESLKRQFRHAVSKGDHL